MQVCCISGKKTYLPEVKTTCSFTSLFIHRLLSFFFLFFFCFFFVFYNFFIFRCCCWCWLLQHCMEHFWRNVETVLNASSHLSLSLSLWLFILCIIYWMNGESIKSGFQFRVFLLLSWSKRWNMVGIISICGINSKSLAFIGYLNLVINSLRLQTGIRSKFVEYLKTWITP